MHKILCDYWRMKRPLGFLVEQIRVLQGQVEKLGRRIESLLEENQSLLEALRTAREAHEGEAQRLRDRICELEQQLAEAQRAKRRQAAPFSRGQKKEQPKKPGCKAGHPGAKRERPEQVDRTLCAPQLTACDCCGGPLSDVKIHENDQTDLPPVPVAPLVTRFRFASGWCSKCKRRVFSRHEEQISSATGAAAAHLGPRVLALISDWKGRLGLPLRKISGMLETVFGLKVSAGAMAQVMARLAQRALPTLEAMKQALAQEKLVHADETGWRVDARSAWLWVICSQRFTVYVITQDRRAALIALILGKDFSGFLMRDGWQSYDAQLSFMTMLRCLLHLKRNAEALEDAQEGKAAEDMGLFVLWLDGVFALRQRAHELDASTYRREAEAFIVWLDEFVGEAHCSPANQRFAQRLAEIRAQVVPIIENPLLPATNNLAERQIRPAVIHRKISAGNKTENGARALAILASLSTSCQQQEACFFAWMHHLLTTPKGQAVPFWGSQDPLPT